MASTDGPEWHDEAMHQMARCYHVYLEDAFTYEDWPSVLKWSQRIFQCLSSKYSTEIPAAVIAKTPARRKPLRSIEPD